MIPAFNISNVLPPFVGSDPTSYPATSPYDISMTELVSIFGTSPQRLGILDGLIRYRKKLKQLNITDGFQLIDGSFVENCEVLKGRPPADIDIVTFAHVQDAANLLRSNLDLFDPAQSKDIYLCDAYFVNLSTPTQLVVDASFYWFGLFSHQRATNLWKGMLRLPLDSDDESVLNLLKDEITGGAR